MIKMQDTGTGWAPVILCDQCGERITDAGMAMAVFERSMTGGLTPVRYLHKGVCDVEAHGEKNAETPWEELSTHLARLLANAGMTPARLTESSRTADLLTELGRPGR